MISLVCLSCLLILFPLPRCCSWEIDKPWIGPVYFRKETLKNSGHRNVFRNNTVVDNGSAKDGYGFYISDATRDIVIEKNKIADTRKAGATQKVAIYKTPGAGTVASRDNDLGQPLRP